MAQDTKRKSRLFQIASYVTVRVRRRFQHRRGDEIPVLKNAIRCSSGVFQCGKFSSGRCRRVIHASVIAVVGHPNTRGIHVNNHMLLSVAASARAASAACWDATGSVIGVGSVRCTSGLWENSAQPGRSYGQRGGSTAKSCRAMLIASSNSISSILVCSESL